MDGAGGPRTPYGNLTPPVKPSWLSEPEPAPVDRTMLERLRHCWVHADEHGRVPALLLEWRETPSGGRAAWCGRCSTSRTRCGGRGRKLPAEQLEQA
jgi:hypothetical protein